MVILRNNKKNLIITVLVSIILLLFVGCGKELTGEEYLAKVTKGNKSVVSYRTALLKEAQPYSAAYLQMEDEFFNKSIKEQYDDIVKIYNQFFQRNSLCPSMVIQNTNSESIYQIKTDAENATEMYKVFYVFSLDRKIDMYDIDNGKYDLNNLDKDTVLAVDYSMFEKTLEGIEKDKKDTKRQEAQLVEEAKRKENLKGKKPQIGMTEDEVINSSWGNPKDINKTTTAYGTREQWVYSLNKYIYLDDGIVTAIQE